MPSQELHQEPYSRTCQVPTTTTTTPAPNLQPYGNQAAQEGMAAGLAGEPVDIVAYDAGGDHVISIGHTVMEGEDTPFSDFDGMVATILAQAAGRPIGTLKIMVHTDPGMLELGEGTDMQVLGSFTVKNTRDSRYSALAGHFAPNGHVEIHGCNFGQGPFGEAFLVELSEIWGVPVTAGREVQSPYSPGLDGTTVTASPDGKGGTVLTEDSNPIDDAQLRGRDALYDGVEFVSKEVGSLWDWVFGEDN